jgi:DNA-binding response OmpR family regulator
VTRARALVVEDEPDIAGLIKLTLERGGDIRVDIAASGDAALTSVATDAPDLIVLDLNLPVVSGFEVCRMIRTRPETQRIPIIMITARASETDRVVGLEAGADDYITKPFSPRELAARVRAVLRRAAPPPAPATMYVGKSLVVDFDAVSITADGQPVTLTRREFELLRYLVQNRNRVVSRDRLLEHVWGYNHPIETRSVDVHVGRLRTKLRSAAQHIETVVGLGYRFVD